MKKWRIGIRAKLFFLSLFLFAIPWLGYKYVWELEAYLRLGQEQTLVGTARAVATALHERPKLFNNQAAYLKDVKPGTDLYAHKISHPVELDGELDDWREYWHLTLEYNQNNLIEVNTPYHKNSLHFRHMVGQHQDYLYAMFDVTDDKLVYRPKTSLFVDHNDFVQIALIDPYGQFKRYIVAPFEAGWVNAYLLSETEKGNKPIALQTKIQGYWKETAHGYNVELRFPLSMMSSKIAFVVGDVDDELGRALKYTLGTANPSGSDKLGTVLVPSPEIENILKGLQYSNARVWVVDKHMRVLARSGSIHDSTGFDSSRFKSSAPLWWQHFEQKWLLPLYYQILTKPPTDFVDELQDAYELQGQDIQHALNGEPDSLWRLSTDQKAMILSAAHPIYINDEVMGAVVVEQTTHGIRTLRNQALEGLFHLILAVIGLGTLGLFLFASRISMRIRKLRNQTEAAIDHQGKIVADIQPSDVGDEIGDLSRTFYSVLGKLTQYNSYLENMAARLSHELRTPVAVVNSSLENMALEPQSEDNRAYIDRAQQGIQRLSKILQNMSEATRLEQTIQASEPEVFVVAELLNGCVEGYRMAYDERQFSLTCGDDKAHLSGSPDLFAQMLDKIISNAVEFSQPHSEIVLNSYVKNGRLWLSIKNNGDLLPDKMQGQLLDSMVSVRSQSDPNQVHLGLGLFIAKMVAEYHKGQIQLSNLADHSGVEVLLNFKLD
ncbi:proteobacterial dedicated sortase system histidine kinase [Neptunicella marina]|uniref:histidine kinase n=1 Tax=Neptunicella marina TaxID=2125989 RepID=A0A8J6IUW4_9ALTE|nr:proteobacterial dedicated sortase system histidine kinase [Neptunicella marina]MBC3766061.1 proteobacterial dedicated sortase system histidine kinase [Neptunicella marina]